MKDKSFQGYFFQKEIKMRPQVFSVDSGMFCLFEDWVGIKWIHSGTSVPVINSLRNSWWVLKPMSTAWWNILSCRAVSWLIKVLASAISPEQVPGVEILFSRQNATSTGFWWVLKPMGAEVRRYFFCSGCESGDGGEHLEEGRGKDK